MKYGRKELKYYINYIDYVNLKSRISTLFLKDKNSGEKNYYHVRSLYFDNKSNNNYYEKIAGIDMRKKYRIRIYNLNSEPVKLEIKAKSNNIIFKDSALISSADVAGLISGNYSILLDYKNQVLNKIYAEFTKDFYRPVIIIDYEREAYYLDLNKIRITFDRDLRKDETAFNDFFNTGEKMQRVLNNNKIIMEIKYDGKLPSWLRNLLQFERFERCAISKYTLSRYIEG